MQKYRKYKPKRPTRRQKFGGFLNRYDFTYAGRGTVNTAMHGLNNRGHKSNIEGGR